MGGSSYNYIRGTINRGDTRVGGATGYSNGYLDTTYWTHNAHGLGSLVMQKERIVEALQAMFDEYSYEGGDLSILAEDEPDHPLVKAMEVLYELKKEKKDEIV